MRKMKNLILFQAFLVLALEAAPAAAGNSLIAAGTQPKVAHSSLSAKPMAEWNRLSRDDGKNVEVWTIDGDSLNKVSFYGGITSGKPLLREADKKRDPLPKVSATMLMTDIPALLESTYRSLHLVDQMDIGEQAPTLLGGHKAIRFSYMLTSSGDEVRRKGEAIGALVNGKLYLVTFEAPALHFFDKDVEKYRQLADSLSF
jgi:hypothetical protein